MADSDASRVTVGISLPTDVDDENFVSRPSIPDSDERITLKCGQEVFTFSKSKLVKDSDYFRACLKNSTFIEGRTSVIEFDDIEPGLLQSYLDIVEAIDACDQDNVEDFFSSEYHNEPVDVIIPMIEIYRLSDRLMNESMRDILSQYILEYIRKGAVMNVDKSSLEGIEWLFNTYKNAHDTLDSSISDEANLRSQIADVCCRQIAIDKTYALTRTSHESEAFLEAVLMASTQLLASLLKRTRRLGSKVRCLRMENQMLHDRFPHTEAGEYHDWLANNYVGDHDGYSTSSDFDEDC